MDETPSQRRKREAAPYLLKGRAALAAHGVTDPSDDHVEQVARIFGDDRYTAYLAAWYADEMAKSIARVLSRGDDG